MEFDVIMNSSKDDHWGKNICVIDRIIVYFFVIILFIIILLYGRDKLNNYLYGFIYILIIFFSVILVILIRFELYFHNGQTIKVISEKRINSIDSINILSNRIINIDTNLIRIERNFLDGFFFNKFDSIIILKNNMKIRIIISEEKNNALMILLSRNALNYKDLLNRLILELDYSLL